MLYLSVVLTAMAQLLLKIASFNKVVSTNKALILIAGYSLLLLALIFNVIGLRSVPLHHMAFVLPISFILTTVSATFLLGERQSKNAWIGISLIALGALTFNLEFLL